jgi:hypothetical protein
MAKGLCSAAAPKRGNGLRPAPRPPSGATPKRHTFLRPTRDSNLPTRRRSTSPSSGRPRPGFQPAAETTCHPPDRCTALEPAPKRLNAVRACKSKPLDEALPKQLPVKGHRPWRCPGTSNASVRGTWRKTRPALPPRTTEVTRLGKANQPWSPGSALAFRGFIPERIRSPANGGLSRQQARSSPGLHTLQGSPPRHVGTALTPCLPSWASPLRSEDLRGDPPGFPP